MNTQIKKELDQYPAILSSNSVKNSNLYSTYFTFKLSSSKLCPQFGSRFVKSEAAVSYFLVLNQSNKTNATIFS